MRRELCGEVEKGNWSLVFMSDLLDKSLQEADETLAELISQYAEGEASFNSEGIGAYSS